MPRPASVPPAPNSEYDLAGRRTRLIYPGTGFAVNYDYDNAGNLTAVRENAATSGVGVLASFSYDNYGRRTTASRGNGVTSGYSYDALNRLTGLSHNPTGTDYDQTVSYEYNRGSQIVKRIASNEAYTRPIPSKVDRTFTMDGLNRIDQIGATKFSYDANSNLTSDGTKSFGYNNDNQLTSGNGATLTYDALGRLYSVTKNGATTRFIYDGNNLIAEFDTGGTYLRRYVHGAGVDEPLVWLEGSGNSDRRWLLADERGSIVGVTNGSGAVIAVNSYSEYGEPGSANQGRFQYTGQAWIAEVGIYHYKARAYHPGLGRFLQPDPIGYGDGMNLYAYVGGDPIGRTDPSGLWSVTFQNCSYYQWSSDPLSVSAERCTTQTIEFPDVVVDGGGYRVIGGGRASSGSSNSDSDECSAALRTAKQNSSAVSRARDNWAVLQQAGARVGLPASLLAAIGVRETGFRNIAEIGGGKGQGVFQLTNQPTVTTEDAYNVAFSAGYAATMLAGNMQLLGASYNYTPAQLLEATAASYNMGLGKWNEVANTFKNFSGDPSKINQGTANNNYGSNVLALMSCFN